MGYKFQLGDSVLSGSLTQEGDIVVQNGGDSAKGSVYVQAGFLSASSGLRMKSDSTIQAAGNGLNLSVTDLLQIDGITPGTAAASKALVLDASKDIGTIRNLTIDGTFSDGNYTFDTSGNVSGLGTVGCGAVTSTGAGSFEGTLTADTSLTLDAVTITTAEIQVLDGVTAGTATASRALVVDGNKDIVGLRDIAGRHFSGGDISGSGDGRFLALDIDGVERFSQAGIVKPSAISASFGSTLTMADATFTVSNAGALVASQATVNGNVSGSGQFQMKEGALRLSGETVSATAAELNLVDGAAAATIANSKAVIYGASGEVNATTLQVAGVSIVSSVAELNLLQGFASGAYDQANSEIVFVDVASGKLRKEENDAFLTAIAGAGLSVSGNKLVADGASNPVGIGNEDKALVEGFNFGNAALTGSSGANWRLPAAPSNGDIVRVKAPSNIGNSFINITCSLGGLQQIDGQASIRLESAGAAVSLIYLGGNSWGIF